MAFLLLAETDKRCVPASEVVLSLRQPLVTPLLTWFPVP